MSDGAGGILLTRGGTTRAQPIVEGDNLLAGAVDYDGSERFHRYVVFAARPGSDEASGESLRIRA